MFISIAADCILFKRYTGDSETKVDWVAQYCEVLLNV